MKTISTLFLLLFALAGAGQKIIVRDIKSFGARGDGKTNDHAAFQRAAAFFNDRGGHGKLVISKGTYLVGQQSVQKKDKGRPVFEGETLLLFKNLSNLTIEGVNQPVVRYRSGLRFGSFVPATEQASANGNNFFEIGAAATIKNAIELSNCRNVQILNLELDGNNEGIVLGGIWGDMGRQLPHSGIWLQNSTGVVVTNVYVHHFALDGMVISNATASNSATDRIVISNSRFEYNARQGLSWVGGTGLAVVRSKFSHTGKGKFMSPPGAGVDIEAEVGPVRNGTFVDCEFVNNAGCGLLADSGPSSDCIFTRCLFWGVDSWSVWVRKPRFTFDSCTVHGSIVHGYDSPTDADATRFINTVFEDKPYKGKEVFGRFLIESNGARRMRFDNCTMIANRKHLAWLATAANAKPEEKYQLNNCRMVFNGEVPPLNDSFICRDCRFEANQPSTGKKAIFRTDKQGKVKPI